MPSFSNKRITWDKDDWLSSLHPNYSAAAGDTPVPRGNGQLTFALNMNPYRNFGYASPGFEPSDCTNVSVVNSSAIRHIVIGAESNNYYGYGIDSGSRLFQMDGTTAALTNAGVWPHTITSASGTVEGQDVVNYNARIGGTRAPRIFYSFNNNAAAAANPLWNVGAYSLDGATFDDDFMTTAPATPLSNASAGGDAITYPIPMIVGDDDVLYIGNGNKVHAYDGADTSDPDGKFIDSVLTLPDSFRVTSFAKLRQRLVIFGYKEWNVRASAGASSFYATEAKAYFWDYLALDPYDSVNLNDNFCTAGFEYMGTVGCFTQGRKPVQGSQQFAKMMLYNGSEFEAVAMIDNNIPIHGGVQIAGDTVMFNAAGKIYQYGSPYPGFPNGLNKVAAGLGTTSGAIITLTTTMQVASSGTTTSGGLQKFNNQYSTGQVSAALAEPEFTEGHKGQMRSLTIVFGKTSTGGREASVFLCGNDLATTTILSAVSTVDSTNIIKKYEFTSAGATPPLFTNVKPIITWGSGSGATDAPIIDKIILDYDEVNLEAT